jgi:quinol-cytochrome oxidoreductase complex cytochrome b subunit
MTEAARQRITPAHAKSALYSNAQEAEASSATAIPRSGGKELAPLDIVSIASEIAEAGTGLAGLILVYLGAVAVRYETLDPKDQSSARDVYRRHARRAFRGIVIALIAAIAALTAKALKSEPYATMIAAVAGVALLMSFFIAAMAAYWILTSLD